MSRKLGIMQFQQKLPRAKKLEIMRENVISGKKREQEVAEETRISLEKQEQEKRSRAVSSLAEFVSKLKGISIVEATAEAQKIKARK